MDNKKSKPNHSLLIKCAKIRIPVYFLRCLESSAEPDNTAPPGAV